MIERLLTKPPNLCEYYTNIVTRLRSPDTTCYSLTFLLFSVTC